MGKRTLIRILHCGRWSEFVADRVLTELEKNRLFAKIDQADIEMGGNAYKVEFEDRDGPITTEEVREHLRERVVKESHRIYLDDIDEPMEAPTMLRYMGKPDRAQRREWRRDLQRNNKWRR